jgi:hypothetical protein
MTWKEALNAVSPFDQKQRVRWLHDLGWAMTVSARAGYPAAQQGVDSIPHLIAFNELQHQLFNYLRESQTKDDWTIEKFVEGLYQKAASSGVEGDFGWALKYSIEQIGK